MRYTGFHRAVRIWHGEWRRTWPIHFENLVEATALDELRQAYSDNGEPPPSYTAMVVKAIALGIAEVSQEFPEINSMLTGFLGFKTIHTFDRISAGVAVSRTFNGEDRVVQSVVQSPESVPLIEITDQLRDRAIESMEANKSVKSEYFLYGLPGPIQRLIFWTGRTFPENRRMYRGTFALTTVGKFGVDIQATLPQAACLQFGFGAVAPRPIVRNDEVIAAKTFYLSVSFDRRLMNGKPVAQLMERVREILERAEFNETASE